MSGAVSAAILHVPMNGMPVDLLVLGHRLAPDAVGEAGGVGQQVAQRDRPLGRPQLGRARGVEALRAPAAEASSGSSSPIGLLELQLALLDQLHAGRRGHGLGHRRDPEHRVGRHVRAVGHVALAERALVDDPLVGRRDRDDARHGPGVDRLTERLVDRRHRATGQPGFLGRGAPAAGAGHGRYGHERGCRLEKVAAALVHGDHSGASRRL